MAVGLALNAACGSSTPTAPAPVPLNLTGIWDFTSSLTSGTSGLTECTFLHTLGERTILVVTVQDAGGNLTAIAANPANGSSCTYAGTLSGSQFFVQLSSCSSAFTRNACQVNTYDFRPVQGTYTGTATATAINGTGGSSENMYFLPIPPFQQQFQNLAGTNTFQTTFSMTKR